MATPRYFHFYDLPEVDARYGRDIEFTDRCDSASVELFQLLKSEVRALRVVPNDCLTPTVWELCHCTARLVDGIPREHLTIEASCAEESTQLLKLAYRFLEYELVGATARTALESVISSVRGECCTVRMGAAS